MRKIRKMRKKTANKTLRKVTVNRGLYDTYTDMGHINAHCDCPKTFNYFFSVSILMIIHIH